MVSEGFESFFGSNGPILPPVNHKKKYLSASSKSYKYLRRIIKFDQMDFEFAMWQLIYLFTSPQKVYRNFNYRKQTKKQFARDDPAFLVLLILFSCGSSFCFAFALNLSFWQIITFVFYYVVIIDCIVTGIIISTIVWCITNRFLRSSTMDPDIEWGYAFDVHLNAFFPPLVILYFIQLIFFKWSINQSWFLGCLIGNMFWLSASLYYIYVTFLGYNCINHLKKTRLLLTPIPILFICYLISLSLNWNITDSFIHFYKHRAH